MRNKVCIYIGVAQEPHIKRWDFTTRDRIPKKSYNRQFYASNSYGQTNPKGEMMLHHLIAIDLEAYISNLM